MVEQSKVFVGKWSSWSHSLSDFRAEGAAQSVRVPGRQVEEMKLFAIIFACSVSLASAFSFGGGCLTPSAAALSVRRSGEAACRAGASARTPGGALTLRAAGDDGGKKEPADGSIEKILSGLGPMGSKFGAGVDWCAFFLPCLKI